MKLDRKKAPPIKEQVIFDFLKAKSERLKNGIPFHYLSYGKQEIVRIQLVFKSAGTAFQKKPLVASTVNSLLFEGSENHSAAEIATFIENRGAFVDQQITGDTAWISLYCLTKNMREVLPYIKEVIQTAIFPEEEMEKHLFQRKQQFSVNKQKVGFIAKNEFLTFIFGEGHPYSNTIIEEDFDRLKRKDLMDFYHQQMNLSTMEIFAAGMLEEDSLHFIKELFGNEVLPSIKENDTQINFKIRDTPSAEKMIPLKGALQSAIRIGMPIIGKSHPDFPALFMLNTILGGYFGSRLMANIREDKGYTYGIGSALIAYKEAAYFVIATEVGEEHTEATRIEIDREINRLQQELVSESELRLVKNYIKGSVLKSFDGAFAAMDRFRSIHSLGLNYDYYQHLLSRIDQLNAQEIRETAAIYLEKEKLKNIIVGKNEF